MKCDGSHNIDIILAALHVAYIQCDGAVTTNCFIHVSRNYPSLKPLTPALASILNNPTAASTASTSSTTRMDISGYADGKAFSIKPISAAASVRLISSLYFARKGTVHGSCPPIHANARPTTAMTTAVIPSRVASGSCTNWATCGDAHPARMKLSDTINTKIFLISISLFILFPQIVHSYLGEVPEGRRGRQTKNARCQYRHRALFDTSPFTWKGTALFSTILNPQLESVKSSTPPLNTAGRRVFGGGQGGGHHHPYHRIHLRKHAHLERLPHHQIQNHLQGQ